MQHETLRSFYVAYTARPNYTDRIHKDFSLPIILCQAEVAQFILTSPVFVSMIIIDGKAVSIGCKPVENQPNTCIRGGNYDIQAC
jgi:hypothetical protein